MDVLCTKIFLILIVIVFICGYGQASSSIHSNYRVHGDTDEKSDGDRNENENASPSPSSASPPNIVFILADDLGWDDVGFHGSEIKTPNIDKLAKEGVILNNYYVQPICTPTRSAILTGKYPIHTGMQHYVIVGSQPYGLPLKEKTMAQHLKAMGYSTHAVGKWHLGFFKEDYLPTSRGFDSHLGYYLGKEDYFDHHTMDGLFFGYDFHHNGSTLWNQDEVYSTEIFTAQAESIIKSHDKSSPLFMYLAPQAVHSGESTDPIQAPQKYIDRFPYINDYNRRLFAGAVSALDDSVGAVYQALQDSGMADNTIIVFSTDNGGPANGYDRNAACNWPLRGCKNTLWQGGVRGVGFVHSPLLKKSGYVNNNMMHVVDWLPTLLSAANSTMTATTAMSTESSKKTTRHHQDTAGVSPLSADALDGVNQWESISTNANTSRKEVLLNMDPIIKIEAIVVGDFKLLKGRTHHGRFDGWYPPPNGSAEQTAMPYDSWYDADLDLDYEGIFKEYIKSFHNNTYYNTSPYLSKSMIMIDEELDTLIADMNNEFETYVKMSKSKVGQQDSTSDLLFNSEDYLNKYSNDTNIIVKCGPKPANASTNCQPKHKPCIFHLASDPCEYNNLASSLPGVVTKLEGRLDFYRSTMIPPGNKPIDPDGNPQLHGGVWKPWR